MKGDMYWSDFDAGQLVGRANEIKALSEALRKYKRPFIVVHGSPGVGKTSLVRAFVERHAKRFPIIDWITGAAPGTESQVVDRADFRSSAGDAISRARHGSLLIVDDVGRLEYADENASRLFYGPHRAVILISRFPQQIRYSNFTLEVRPVSLSAWMEVAAKRFGREHAADLKRALEEIRLGEIPTAAFPFLIDEWATQSRLSFEKLFAPLDSVGLFGADGKPVGDKVPRSIVTTVTNTEKELIRAVNKTPDLVHTLTPRKFEEFVAELMREQGFSVELTPATRDGGKDVYLAVKQNIGSFLYLVECKQYKTRPVGIGCVQRLYGAIEAERATGGLVVTTSHFSQPAEAFQESVQYRLSLIDYLKLKKMIAEVAGK